MTQVHERNINTDFLLIVLKDLIRRRRGLKVILMSATLRADRLAQYFGASCRVCTGCVTCGIDELQRYH